MLRDQAQHFLLGFLLFNTFCRSFTIDLDVGKLIIYFEIVCFDNRPLAHGLSSQLYLSTLRYCIHFR